MNSGKTTTAASLIHGLKRAGLKVAAVKVTGTGSGGDLWSMSDAGAATTLDFTDLGHASTAGLPHTEVLRVANGLIDLGSASGAEAIRSPWSFSTKPAPFPTARTNPRPFVKVRSF